MPDLWAERDVLGTSRDVEASAEAAAAAFGEFIYDELRPVVSFIDMNAIELGRILADNRLFASRLLFLCGIHEVTMRSELGLKRLDAYGRRSWRDVALVLGGYLKPRMPDQMDLRHLYLHPFALMEDERAVPEACVRSRGPLAHRWLRARQV